MEVNATDELSAMRTLVENFRWTTLNDLRHVIDSLDMRALRVQGQRPEWDREFRKSWGALEEVYAVMKDRGDSSPNDAFQHLIASSIDKLKVMLTPK
jgi:hypothetical protein